MKVQDLDVLRPEPNFIRIDGKDIDVSFIPCGITFDVDEIVKELMTIDMEKAQGGGDEAKKAFMLSIKLCAAFCSFRYPELDQQWFMENSSPQQVKAFAEAIKDALSKAYLGIEEPKKRTATKRKEP